MKATLTIEIDNQAELMEIMVRLSSVPAILEKFIEPVAEPVKFPEQKLIDTVNGTETRRMYDKKCEICGMDYESKQSNSRFCSKKCMNVNYKKNSRLEPVMLPISEAVTEPIAETPETNEQSAGQVPCKICGAWFIQKSKVSRLCSVKCSNKEQYDRAQKVKTDAILDHIKQEKLLKNNKPVGTVTHDMYSQI